MGKGYVRVVDLPLFPLISLLFLPVQLCRCGEGEGAGKTKDTVRVEEITGDDTDGLAGGPDSIGGVGCYRISNDEISVIIDRVGNEPYTGVPYQSVGAHSGGTIIDIAGSGGDNDQFIQASQVVNFDEGLVVSYRSAGIDEIEKEIILSGRVLDLDPGSRGEGLPADEEGFIKDLRVVTTYRLYDGDRYITVETRVKNISGTSSRDISGAGDLIQAGTPSFRTFFPYPGRGFEHPAPEQGEEENNLIFVPFVVFEGFQGNPSSYGIFSEEEGFIEAIHSGDRSRDFPYVMAGKHTLGQKEKGLNPGEELIYTREILVSSENSVSSVTDIVFDELAGAGNSTLVEMGFTGTLTLSAAIIPRGRNRVILYQDYPGRYISPEGELQRVTDYVDYPISSIFTDSEDGKFSLSLPPGEYRLFIDAGDGLEDITYPFTISTEDLDLGTIWLQGEEPGNVKLDIEDNGGTPLTAMVTILGLNGTKDPEFPEWAGSTCSKNRCIVPEGELMIQIPPGEYRFIASKGMGWGIDYEDLIIGGGEKLIMKVKELNIFEGGGLVDPHLHTEKSFDAGTSIYHAALFGVAAGLDGIIVEDHDYITEEGITEEEEAALEGITLITGVEASPILAREGWVDPAGFFCGVPLYPTNYEPSNNAPPDEFLEPAAIFDFLIDPGFYGHSASFIFASHPRKTDSTGRPLGFFESFGYSPDEDIPDFDDGSTNGFLMRDSPLGTGTRNIDFHGMEVASGRDYGDIEEVLTDWYSLLKSGYRKVGVGGSNFHTLYDDTPGFPSTFLMGGELVEGGGLEEDEILSEFSQGHLIVSTGPMIDLEVRTPEGGEGHPGDEVEALSGRVTCSVTVRAASWINIEEVILIVGGDVVETWSAAGGFDPEDPFSASLTRLTVSKEMEVDGDTFLMVRAGLSSITDSSAAGIFYEAVAPGHFPFAVTNPVYIDVYGDGWEPG